MTALFAIFGAPGVFAVVPSLTPEGTVTLDQIEAATSAIEAREDLSEENRNGILEFLRDAQAQVQNRTQFEQDAASFIAATETAPAKIEELTAELNEDAAPPPTAETLGVSEATELRELEQILSRESATLDSAEAQLAQLESEIKAAENRPAEARTRIDELRTEISDIEGRLDEAAPPGELKELTDARKLATELRLRARRAELERLDQEADEDRFRDLVLILFDQASLADGTVPKDSAAYVNRLNQLLLSLLKD